MRTENELRELKELQLKEQEEIYIKFSHFHSNNLFAKSSEQLRKGDLISDRLKLIDWILNEKEN